MSPTIPVTRSADRPMRMTLRFVSRRRFGLTSGAMDTRIVMLSMVLLAGCASAPEAEQAAQEREEDIATILSEPLDPSEYGEAKRCLAGHEYRDFAIIDDRRIVFKGPGNRLWLNELRARCPDLRRADALAFRSHTMSERICELDSFVASDWMGSLSHRSPGMRCTLGAFQPISEPQLQALRDLRKR
jgi:hypothetical protein